MASHLAYRAGLHLAGTGDYTPRQDTLACPAFFVGWTGMHDEFAAAVEASEKRKDAQTLREIVWALPHDATDEQRRRIVADYAASLRERYGVAVHCAIHQPRAQDATASGLNASGQNHHAHLSMTLRAVDDAGHFGAKKIRTMNDRGWLDAEKDRMVSLVNEIAAEKASRAPKYGEPVPTVGRAWHRERRGEQTAAGDRWRAHRAQVEEIERDRAELATVEAEIAADRAELAKQVEAEKAAQPGPEPEPPRRQSIADRIRRSLGLQTRAEEEATKTRFLEATARVAAQIAAEKAAEAERAEAAEREAEAKRVEEARKRMAERAARQPLPPPPKSAQEIRRDIKRRDPRAIFTPGQRHGSKPDDNEHEQSNGIPGRGR